jgi:adenosylcobinamide-phosphate synthase
MQGEIVGGIFLVVTVVLISTLVPCIILYIAYHLHVIAGIVIESIFCYQLLATKSLKTESMKVYDALKEGNVSDGRKAVSMIVGRDTQNLTEEGIVKATVETVAENTSDGIIAPLLFMMIGGAGLGFLYKAVNTMDSMVGYKNEKYIYLGRAAAKMDDFLNYIPARLSAYLMILAALFGKYDVKNAWNIYWRDRYNHASPNSAQTEAVAAGALSVQLAGNAYYFGKLYEKKTIGDPIRPIKREDISKINQLLYITAILGMVMFGGIKGIILFLI